MPVKEKTKVKDKKLVLSRCLEPYGIKDINAPDDYYFIALDLSLSDTGICVRGKKKYSFYNFQTFFEKTEIYTTERRIKKIIEFISRIIQQLKWSCVIQPWIVIENYAFSKNNAYASKLQELGGVVKNWLYDSEVDFTIISAGTWKKVLGKGNLKKEDVKATVLQKYGCYFKNQNICDAFCMIKFVEQELGLPGHELPKEVE